MHTCFFTVLLIPDDDCNSLGKNYCVINHFYLAVWRSYAHKHSIMVVCWYFTIFSTLQKWCWIDVINIDNTEMRYFNVDLEMFVIIVNWPDVNWKRVFFLRKYRGHSLGIKKSMSSGLEGSKQNTCQDWTYTYRYCTH